ncbi:MlaC/ttg2D family ABC transporter substrate-binding protein [Hirschia maritima]|uniref:MlaC/ttg2D family ABC transporter substrate-binding protein n=1 Tax=Hirschia maritima TaxID=1121961 RepID=UPI000371A445|nr:ABC transporter substrate-binding protein [Hirschia maritima]
MKKLVLSTLLLLSASTAWAEAPSQLIKTGLATTSQKDISKHDAKSVVSLAGNSAIEFLNDGNLSDSEAQALLGFLDIERVARFTLGRHGRALSAAEIERFTVAFENYASKQFQTHLSAFAGANLSIVDTVELKPTDTVVKTEIRTENGNIQKVNWRLLKRENQWNVVDVEALGFWFAIEQRAQFSATLDKSGGDITALIQTLNAK